MTGRGIITGSGRRAFAQASAPTDPPPTTPVRPPAGGARPFVDPAWKGLPYTTSPFAPIAGAHHVVVELGFDSAEVRSNVPPPRSGRVTLSRTALDRGGDGWVRTSSGGAFTLSKAVPMQNDSSYDFTLTFAPSGGGTTLSATGRIPSYNENDFVALGRVEVHYAAVAPTILDTSGFLVFNGGNYLPDAQGRPMPTWGHHGANVLYGAPFHQSGQTVEGQIPTEADIALAAKTSDLQIQDSRFQLQLQHDFLDVESLPVAPFAPGFSQSPRNHNAHRRNVQALADIAVRMRALTGRRASQYSGFPNPNRIWTMQLGPEYRRYMLDAYDISAEIGADVFDVISPEWYEVFSDQAHITGPKSEFNPIDRAGEDIAIANMATWLRDEASITRARFPGKRLIPWMWPMFHSGAQDARTHEFKGPRQWRAELEMAKELADGVIIWSGYDVDAGGRQMPWDESAPWWQETKAAFPDMHFDGA